MGFFNRTKNWFSDSNAVETKSSGWGSSISNDSSGTGNFNDKEMLNQLYENPRLHPILKIVTDFETADFAIYKKTAENRKGDVIQKHPLYKWVENVDPFTAVTGNKALGICMANYLVAGESILLLQGSGDEGYLVAIPKEDIVKRPTDLGVAGQYLIKLNGKEMTIQQGTELFAVFKNPHPRDPKKSVGRYASLASEAGLSMDMLDYERHSINEGGRPDAMIMLEGAEEEQVTAFSRMYKQAFQGKHNARKTLVVGDKVEVQPLTTSRNELDYTNSKRANAELIEENIGLPPETYGKLKNSNKATATVAGTIYGREVKKPLYKYFAKILTQAFVYIKPSYKRQTLTVAFDGIVPEDDELVMKYAKEGLVNGALMVNEYREIFSKMTSVDIDSLPDVSGRRLIQPLNSGVVDVDTGEITNPNSQEPETPPTTITTDSDTTDDGSGDKKVRIIKTNSNLNKKEINLMDLSDNDILVTVIDDDVGGNNTG